MKYYESKFSKFLSGRGFYLVLALCLIAIGAAAWSAYAGIIASDEDTADAGSASSYTLSVPSAPAAEQPSSAAEAGTEASEPYSEPQSEVPSEAEDEPEAEEPPVATSYVMPVTGNIAKSFSDTELKYSNTYKDMRLHTGIDITAEAGTAVKSAGNGTVVAIINDALLGVYVEINHGNGITARYCGLSDSVNVNEGDTVKAGTKLGTLATVPSECVDETHLHLEFYRDSIPADPLTVMGIEQ